MMVDDIFAVLQQNGIKLHLDDQSNLRVISQKSALTPHLIAQIKDNKPQILSWLLELKTQSRPDLVRIERANALMELSFSQKRLWFIDKMNGSSIEYNMPMTLKIEGAFNIDVATNSIIAIIERHSPLRTIFIESSQGPMQQVLTTFDFDIKRIDLSEQDQQSQSRKIRELQIEDGQTSFDLSRDLMIRSSFIDIGIVDGQPQGILLFNMHHIASDGWSMGVLIQEFVDSYKTLSKGHLLALEPLEIEYIDYISWQRKMLDGPLLAGGLNYWQSQLADIPKVHGLILDKPRAMNQTYFGANHRQFIEKLDVGQLSWFCRQHNVTEFILLQSLFALLLSRYSQHTDIVVGTPVAGREARVLEPLIGFFINNLVIRTDCSGDLSFAAFLDRSKKTVLDAYRHQEIPFDLLVEELNPKRDMSHDPIFQLVFTVNNNEVVPLELPELTVSMLGSEEIKAKVELEVNTNLSERGVVIDWTYNTALFSEATIVGLATSFTCLLKGAMKNPNQSILALSLMDVSTFSDLTSLSAGSLALERSNISLAAQFEHWVKTTPNACACVCSGEELSYARLGELCRKLAGYLQQMDVKAGARVGVCLPRSLAQLVAVVGIIQSGASYVALEPDFPEARLQHMVNDSDIELVLITARIMDNVTFSGVDVLLMDELLLDHWLAEFADDFEPVAITPQSEAYVLYTSGSSGRPKGVQINHGGLSHYLAHAQSTYLNDDITGAVVSSPLCFDATLTTLLTPLCAGKSVHLLSDGDAALNELSQYLFDEDNNWLFKLTPAHLDALVYSGESHSHAQARHKIVIGGEQLRVATLAQWKGRLLTKSSFINEYGPTETVVGTSFYVLETAEQLAELADKVNVPIGKPVAGSQLFVVGSGEQLQPIGSVGELYIGGAGLALGYVNLAEQTAAAFAEFNGQPVYKTGDLAYWLPSGDLVFIGRRDEQVKIRGYRIELGEISEQLMTLDTVQEAFVSAHSEAGQEARLAAYVVAPQLTDDTLSETCMVHLRANLPDYMMPSYFTLLQQMPLTTNGKVDTKALPSPLRKDVATQCYVEPANDLEKLISASWKEAMSLEKVGVKDNFFSIGGDSILSIRVVSLLKWENILIEIKDIFSHQTVEQLAVFIESRESQVSDYENLEPFVLLTEQEHKRVSELYGELIEDAYPLSTLQSGMVFHTQMANFNGIYHDVNAEHLICPWHQEHFETAFAACIHTHPILRSNIDIGAARSLQLVYKTVQLPLVVQDISEMSEKQQQCYLTDWYEQRKHHVFDWLNGPLFSINIFLRSTESFEFVISFHHCVMDGWSRASFTTQLYTHYQKLLAGVSLTVEQPNWIYREYIALELAAIEQAKSKDYFARKLEDAPGRQLPRVNVTEESSSQGEYVIEGFVQRSEALLALARSLGVPLQVILLAAHFKALSVISGQPLVVTCVVSNGRPEREGGETGLGLFLNSMPMAINVTLGSWLALIHQIAAENTENIEHRYYPLALIQKDNDMTFSEVLFNYTHFHVLDQITEQADEQTDIVQVLSSSGFEQTNFDFQVDVVRSSGTDQLFMRFKYDANLYRAKMIAQLGGYYLAAVDNLLNDIHANHSQHCLLSSAQQQYLLKDLHPSPVTVPAVDTVVNMFVRCVEATPQATAVSYQGQTLSYAELDSKANQVAHHLITLGVKADTLVGLSVPRSLDMVVGIVAILKAGGAYLPLDPDYPHERLRYMVQDSGLALLLCQGEPDEWGAGYDIQAVDITALSLNGYPEYAPDVVISTGQLAYVIYTSGSTGQPKGVMVEHGNVQRLMSATQGQFGFCADDVWCLFHSYSFDFSVWEIWGALAYGGRLVIVPGQVVRSTEDFYALVAEEEVTVLNQTPTAFSQFALVDAQQQTKLALRSVIFGGEALNLAGLRSWVERHGDEAPQLINMYGITETTVHVTYRRITTGDIEQTRGSLIGSPIADLSVYILDGHQQPVPVNTCGEMYVGGRGVTRGYLHQEALTNSRFIVNPFESGQRLYRTGDLARYLDGGEIEYLGRIDAQVKIRGFRIELGEIEQQLLRLEPVSACVVVVREDDPSQKRLVAYVSHTSTEDEASYFLSLREQLQKSLPDYMVPTFFVSIAEWPLTANGKIDKKALPAPDGTELMGEYIAPTTETEIKLTQIWAELLRIDKDKISVMANFFELGGHSLLSVRLTAEVRTQLSSDLAIKDIFEAPTLMQMAKTIEQNHGQESRTQVTAISRTSNQLPPSFAQQRLWFIDQMDEGSTQYNMPGALRFQGNFNEDVVEQAFRRIIARHEPLRTVFINTEEGCQQLIREQFEFHLSQSNLSHLTQEAQEQAIQQAARKDFEQVFNLTEDLMVRSSFIRLSAEEGVLLFNMHHIASDGWSMGLLVNEFMRQYQAISEGKLSPFEPLPIQYADYAQWQRNWLEGEVLERQLDYWEHQLAELPQAHSLPLDRARPKIQSFAGAYCQFEAEEGVCQALKQIALKHQATLFMVLQGAFSLLLSRHSNHDDIVMGIPVANRLQKELESLIGFFVNTLVLRTDCSGNPSFEDFLKQVKETNLDAQANQDVPFEHLVERLKPARSTRHSPLFQIMFSMNTNESTEFSLPNLTLSPLTEGETQAVAKFELTLNATETTEGLYFSFEYNRDLFDAKSIETLAQHFNILLKGIAENPQSLIADLPILSEEETHYLIHTLNDTQADYPKASSIHELFEQQVTETPDAIALVFEQSQLSYQALNEKANRLAHYLRAQGVAPDQLVGLCVERSLDMVIGLMAILKAGGAYVPLDPNYSQSRIDYMVKDSGIRLLLTQNRLVQNFQSGTDTELLQSITSVLLDDTTFQHTLNDYPDTNPARLVGQSPDNLAYVIYTSGSTGQPKGVMVEHGNVVSLCNSFDSAILGKNSVMLQAANISFDAATFEVWGCLLYGGRLVICPNGLQDFKTINSIIQKEEVTCLWMTSGLFLGWSYQNISFKALKWVFAGGDVLDAQAVGRVYAKSKNITVINGYGPTENTTFSCCYKIPRNFSDALLPIGKTLSNRSCYIVCQSYLLAPIGTVGELYVGGAGVARGYLNNPVLTAESFIQNTFSEDPTERLYKTGDLVRYLSDGNLEFIGRIDDQVKIRGFRIELGEIEHQLTEIESVASALVLAREDDPGQKRLVAYVSSTSTEDEASYVSSLREQLQKSLPDYMVPTFFVLVEEWPLTANGKIDKKVLPAPDVIADMGLYISPQTETQKQLAIIWARLLRVDSDKISRDANFFELGGHSLLSMRLVAQIRSGFDVELAVRHVFDTPLLSAMAQLIEDSEKQCSRPVISAVERTSDRLPCSFSQQRLWFIDQLEGGSAHYNLPLGFKIEGPFNAVIAEQAFYHIIERHESLRTSFSSDGEQVWQHIQSEFEFKQAFEDISHMDEEQQSRYITEVVTSEFSQPFDLKVEILLRSRFIRLSELSGVLLCNMHHIASDGWSMTVLMNEFTLIYRALESEIDIDLPILNIQYADYAQWQRQWLSGDVLNRQLDYWSHQLADIPSVHSLPLSYQRPDERRFGGGIHGFAVEKSVLDGLNQVAMNNNCTLFMVLHSAFALMLARCSYSDDIVIGTVVANRLQQELEPLVGFFVNTLVLRTDSSVNVAFVDYLEQVRQVNLDAQSHQDVPFELLVEKLNPTRSVKHSPLFQIMFSMDTNEAAQEQLSDLSLTPLSSENITAKFELKLTATVSEQGLWLSFEYNLDVFSAKDIARFEPYLRRLLNGITADANCPIHQLPMLDEGQYQQQLQCGIGASVVHANTGLFHQLFETSALQHPDKVALRFDDLQLSFQAVNAQANQLARLLRQKGVGADSLVGICVQRSAQMVVNILAILKAGAAYVPLDPNSVLSRIQYVVNDTEMTCLFAGVLLPVTDVVVIDCEDEATLALCCSLDDTNLEPLVGQSEDSLAYVIYTSGSTGQPKGVMIEHRSVVNLAHSIATLGLKDKQQAWGWLASVFFDSSVKGLSQLFMGQTLAILREDCRLDTRLLAQSIDNQQICVVDCTPSVLEVWLSQGAGEFLPDLAIGGEVISSHLWHLLNQHQQQTGHQSINFYGPTECTVNSSWSRVSGVQVNIGCPIPNSSSYILNQAGQLQPLGSIGELCIGGIGVARGYLSLPLLTGQQFVDVTFADGGVKRLYRTGDLAKWNEQGQLIYCGRNDTQVKIRGYRIEPKEIECQLGVLAFISQATVMIRNDPSGEKRIVGYCAIDREHEQVKGHSDGEVITAITDIMATVLPAYMQPDVMMLLDSLPLTPNGKVDFRALPVPDVLRSEYPYVAPEGNVEIALAEIFSDLLLISSGSISRRDNFFVLGGHSLMAMRLIAKIRSIFSAELLIRDVFEMPVLSQLATLIGQAAARALRPRVKSIQREGQNLPLSFAQQRLWFIDQLEGGSVHYNMPMALKITGNFKQDIAEQAFMAIIQRHEPLRTVFEGQDEQVWQRILPTFEFALAYCDISTLEPSLKEEELAQMQNDILTYCFDLQQDLKIRAGFVRQSSQQGILFCNIHHIASDGWSMRVLMDEFGLLYRAFNEGQANPLAPLTVQYADYAYWQRQWLTGDVLEKQLQYWRDQLTDMPLVHSLPLSHSRPKIGGYEGATDGFVVDKLTLDGLTQLAKEQKVTLFILLHSVFSLMVARVSYNEDVVIGTPVANRLQQELEPLVGFFVNTLVLRTHTRDDLNFIEYLENVRQVVLDAQTHQDIPFEYLVEQLNPIRNTRFSPLFQIMFSLNNAGESHISGNSLGEQPVDQLEFESISSDTVMSRFELELTATVTEQGIRFAFDYNTGVFDAATIVQFKSCMQQLVQAVVVNPHASLYRMPMLTSLQTRQMIEPLNLTLPIAAPQRLIDELFEYQVIRTPDAIALVTDTHQLSYQQLNEKANQLACYLKSHGVGFQSLVGLCVTRNESMVIAILAILKAGGAYVPIDPEYPQSRIEFLLSDSGVKLLLCEKSVVASLSQSVKQVVTLDDMDFVATLSRRNLSKDDRSPLNNAYLIYTSGSTGKPKGVPVSHANLVNYVDGAQQHYQVREDDRVLQFSSISFDASVEEIFVSLIHGGTLVLRNDDIMRSSTDFWSFVAQHQVSVLSLPTAYWELINHTADEVQWRTAKQWVRLCIIGGEYAKAEIVDLWNSHFGIQLLNTYGPTECTVVATVADLSNFDSNLSHSPPIGKPLANYRCYIVNQAGQLQPFGSVGELCIGGPSVVAGYLNRSQLTAQQFIANSFVDEKQNRLYKTGDLVRYNGDGQLLYEGRIDDQVKIRGFRVELGEIEYQLQQLPFVYSTQLLVFGDLSADKRLVAFCVVDHDHQAFDYVSADGQSQEVRRILGEKMPRYMLPSAIVLLESMPMTTNGKVDKKALASRDDNTIQTSYVAPESEISRAVADIWADVLDLDVKSISADANFFELGGHSLLIMTLVHQVRVRFATQLNLNDVFEAQTLTDLARRIEQGNSMPSDLTPGLVKLQTGETEKSPLILIHAVGGQILSYRDMVISLDYDGPVYGVAATDTDSSNIGQMAADYVDIIRNIVPQGKLSLAGWSMGGVVAVEMARIIQTQGVHVEHLILIDTHTPQLLANEDAQSNRSSLAQVAMLAAELDVDVSHAGSLPTKKLEQLTTNELLTQLLLQAQQQKRLPVSFELAHLQAQFELLQHNQRLFTDHRCLPYDGQVHLLKADEGRFVSTSLGWEALAKQLAVIDVVGNHFSIMQRPRVTGLAHTIDQILANKIN